jgi:hypothetical protein
MHRKLVVAALVAMLAFAATALAATHATGLFKGTTSQGQHMQLRVGAATIKGGTFNVVNRCTRNGRTTIIDGTSQLGAGIPINGDGTFGSRQHARNSSLAIRIAGEVKGRRADGRYEETFNSRFGKCRSGRIFFRAQL